MWQVRSWASVKMARRYGRPWCNECGLAVNPKKDELSIRVFTQTKYPPDKAALGGAFAMSIPTRREQFVPSNWYGGTDFAVLTSRRACQVPGVVTSQTTEW